MAPYAVNQIAHPTNERLEHDMQVCVEHKVPIIITSLQANPMVIEAVHGYGGLVFHDVTNIRHAKKALSMGVDGLILITAGAGGHAGALSPFALLSEEANADPSYKEMILDSSASDIVYTNLFTGVHGNYLRGSIEKAGLDPDNLPVSDKSKMSFEGGSSKSKAWKDIWGAGQGVGGINQMTSVAETVTSLRNEYESAKQKIAGNS